MTATASRFFPPAGAPEVQISWTYLNSILKNAIKILVGFIPAFATFYLTKDWWVLAWFGGLIWFGITGLRNILQMVFGAGGIRPSPLLKWDSYVKWGRLSDSLLFTGLSVPLLDYIVKTLILDRYFGITASTSPVMLYTVIAAANESIPPAKTCGAGFQGQSSTANLFRTVLSIPLALFLNFAAGSAMAAFGVVDISGMLESGLPSYPKWLQIASAELSKGWRTAMSSLRRARATMPPS